MKTVLVVGAGPAGMAAAIMAAREGAKVTLLEGENAPGKKLLLTGNGKCNLTNLAPGTAARYASLGAGDAGVFAGPATEAFGPEAVCGFFEDLGMPLTARDGWVYPASQSARTVLDALKSQLSRYHVTLKCSEKIVKIRQKDGLWEAMTPTWTYRGDALILCAGSKAVPETGSDGSGYELAAEAGHGLTGIYPALTALVPEDISLCRQCAGVRCAVTASIAEASGQDAFLPDSLPRRESGELQIAADAISGIAVFQLSRTAVRLLEAGKRPVLTLDLFAQYDEERLTELLIRAARAAGDLPAAKAFGYLAAPKLVTWLLGRAGISPQESAGKNAEEKARALARLAKHVELPIAGTRPFTGCQVCAGGVETGSVDPATMASRLAPGLYFAGEILDIDGPCGGFNLQWAFASGMLAGKSAAAYIADGREEDS